VCAWINPYISQRADIFQEGVKNGYFVKRTNGDVWQWYVVCSNPPIARWEIYGLIQAHTLTLYSFFISVKYFLGSGKASGSQENEHQSYRFIQLR
jgi:hypothetical protein